MTKFQAPCEIIYVFSPTSLFFLFCSLSLIPDVLLVLYHFTKKSLIPLQVTG